MTGSEKSRSQLQSPRLPSDRAVDLVKEFEGLRLEAYRDPVGVLTIGWGHTNDVREGQVITVRRAEELLAADLRRAGDLVNRAVKAALTQPQFDALVSFVFNVGPGMPGRKDGFVWLKSGQSSTMLRRLNDGDYLGAAREFGKWRRAGTEVLDGLVRRRAAERKLFETKEGKGSDAFSSVEADKRRAQSSDRLLRLQ